MTVIKAAGVLLVNFILYLAFGSFFTVRKKEEWSVPFTVTVGFFAYYAVFALFCFPVMFTYRPLSTLAGIWIIPCVVILAVSAVLHGKSWVKKAGDIAGDISANRTFWICIGIITLLTTVAVVITYSFTLDAAYYVANVTTNVDTDMINVYDPFTGNWQDHFELRYVFATYSVNDSVICRITGLPALIQTKGVMSATVMLIVNGLYVFISRFFYEDHKRALLMFSIMTLVNCMFISIYTASNFLMTRTYEGKSIVGNVSIIAVFVIYMMLVSGKETKGLFIILFIVCLGTATVSSTANMVIPAQVFTLFAPYAVIKRKFTIIPKIAACVVPELVMMLIYVMYVKGYFAIYTFPR